MVTGLCHLCGEEAALIESHVLPEFFYEGAYDEGHRFISVTNHPLHRPRPMQRGFTERLLCASCDNKLSRHETYAASLLRRIDSLEATVPERIIVPDVNFESFRLFGLSILWRAHVASGHMFRDVKLGPHAARIRDMLRSEDPGEPHEYGFTIAKIVGLATHGQMMIAPRPARYRDRRVYALTARGYEWVFMVSTASAELRDIFPYVGCDVPLIVPTIAHDKRRLFSALRRAFPKSLVR